MMNRCEANGNRWYGGQSQFDDKEDFPQAQFADKKRPSNDVD